MAREMRESHDFMVREHGETFALARGDTSHQVRGIRNPQTGVISLTADADVQDGDQLTSIATREVFVITTVTPHVLDDRIIYTEARYETTQQRTQRLAAEQRQIPHITIGTVQGSILNLTSQLHNVTQTITTLPNSTQAEKDALAALMQQLSAVLSDASIDYAEDAETVSERAEALAKEARKAKPNHAFLTASAEGLKEAAANLAIVLPAVLPIATQLADAFLKAAHR